MVPIDSRDLGALSADLLKLLWIETPYFHAEFRIQIRYVYKMSVSDLIKPMLNLKHLTQYRSFDWKISLKDIVVPVPRGIKWQSYHFEIFAFKVWASLSPLHFFHLLSVMHGIDQSWSCHLICTSKIQFIKVFYRLIDNQKKRSKNFDRNLVKIFCMCYLVTGRPDFRVPRN